jgi:hypothetical protein
MSSVRRSDTSKSLDLFCFMNCNAASMICSLGTSSQKIYCYHLTAKMKVCFLIVFLTFFFKYKDFNFGSQNIKRSVKYKKNISDYLTFLVSEYSFLCIALCKVKQSRDLIEELMHWAYMYAHNLVGDNTFAHIPDRSLHDCA